MAAMTAFYFLSFSNNKKLLRVEDYSLGQFDLAAYWRGANLQSCRLEELQLSTSINALCKPTDYIGNPLGLVLTSEILSRIIESSGQVDSARVKIFNALRKSESIPAWVLNPSEVLENCLDSTTVRLRDGTVHEPVIIESMVPEDLQIFRIRESLGTVFMRRSLADKIGHLTGLELVCVESVARRTNVSG